MKNSYIVLLLLLAFTGFIAIGTDTEETVNPAADHNKSVNNPTAENRESPKEIYEHRTEDSTGVSIIAAPDSPSTKNQGKAGVNIENIETPELEPTSENSTAAATGEFSDEINFPNKENDCTEFCDTENADLQIADSAKVNAPAVGEFADQINADAIFAQAQQKDPGLQQEAKLADIPADSSPPTELNAYSPPQ